MKLVICALRDSAMSAFTRPMFAPTAAMIVRSVADELRKPDSGLAQHPEDYELFELGTFDEDTGLFDTGTPKSVVRCKDLVRG